jgi:hypothetical protein
MINGYTFHHKDINKLYVQFGCVESLLLVPLLYEFWLCPCVYYSIPNSKEAKFLTLYFFHPVLP